MALSVGVVLGAYVILCLLLLYFCVIADPETNDIAYFVTYTLPNTIWQKLGTVLGQRQMQILSVFLERSLVLAYFVVVLGSWTIVFWFVYPWISKSSHVSDVHKYIGYIVFVACFGSWFVCSRTSPGIITINTMPRYDHYPYDNLLFLPKKLCSTTKLKRLARSKFDRLKYNQNVPRYDHFCGWVHNTIGEENYRWFLLFLAIHVVMCVYGTVVVGYLIHGEIKENRLFEVTFFDRTTGISHKANWGIVLQYLFAQYILEVGVFVLMAVMGIALGLFLAYHIYLTNNNMTTNEASKWSDVSSWYKKQKKKYNEAVKKGLVRPPSATGTTPDATTDATTVGTNAANVPISDGDVTCTPTIGGGTAAAPVDESSNSVAATTNQSENSELTDNQQTTLFVDPGPVPKNIYDRGLVENWKEVIFPLSLRKEAFERLEEARRYAAARRAAARKNNINNSSSNNTGPTTSPSDGQPSNNRPPTKKQPVREALQKPKVT